MPINIPKFTKPSEAKLWYYEDFLTILEDEKLMPNRAEDWKRLQAWNGEKLVPVMPDGFTGTPSDEQIEALYNHMKEGKLFLFELGNPSPVQIDNWHLQEVKLNPQAPEAPVAPKLDPIAAPTVPNPDELDDPNSISQEELEANRAIWIAYNKAVREQEGVMNNFRPVEIAYETDLKIYENNVKKLEELGQGFKDAVNAYNEGRDMAQEAREANARNLNANLRKEQRNRNKAEFVTTNLMAPRPKMIHEIFFDPNRDVPAPDRGILHSSATFDYEVFKKELRPAGYDLYVKNVFSDYDAATINLAMIGATTEMENVVRTQMKDVGGPLAIKNNAIDGMYFLLSGTFGKVRKHQPQAVFMSAALRVGERSIQKYFEGDPTMLGKNLAESVRNLKSSFSAQQQSDLTVDLVAGTNLAERMLKLFDKYPDILAATGLEDKELEFLRGYVQMGKVFDNYSDAHIKLNEADALGSEMPAQEKAGLLADVVIRRMIENELVKDKKRIEDSDAYKKFLEKAMKDDEKLYDQFEQWKAKNYPNSNRDEQILDEYKKTHDVSQNMNATSRYPAEHKVIAMLAKPGMLERLRQAVSNDPAILEMAQQPELPIKAKKLFRGTALDNLAKQLQPQLQNSEYHENEKHNWFVGMKARLVQGKGKYDPEAISPWLNSKVAGDANRLMLVQTDVEGNKTMRPVAELLENGLRSLEDPDQKTMNQLHNWANDGDLYYYDVGKDMPMRLKADGDKASFEHLVVPPKPGFWKILKTLAYYLTFGNAFADEVKSTAKDRDPEAVDLFLNAKAERAAVAANEEATRRQAAPKVKSAPVDPSQIWNKQRAPQQENAERKSVDDPYAQAVNKAHEEAISFKRPISGTAEVYPQYSDKALSIKVYEDGKDKTFDNHRYIKPALLDLNSAIYTAVTSKKTTQEQIVKLMARAVILQAIKKESVLYKDGKMGPIEEQMRKDANGTIKTMMNDPTFKKFTENASVDMLKHFFMVDGEVNMEEAISQANKVKDKQPEAEHEVPQQVKQSQGLGMN